MVDELKFDLWMNALVFLSEQHNTSITDLARGLGASYSYIFNLCVLMHQKKLISIVKSGRTNVVELTNLGWKCASHVKDLKKITLSKEEEQ